MKSKKKKPKSDNIKKYMSYFLVFVLGILVSCGVVYVTAANVIRSSEVRYDNSTSGLTSDNVQGAIEELNTNATNFASLTNRMNNIGKELYPVGSIFISVSSTNPGNFLGGTWVAFGTGRTLVGINTGDGDFNSAEKAGGSMTSTLAVANLPSHTHSIPQLTGTTSTNGAHTHNLGYRSGVSQDGPMWWSDPGTVDSWGSGMGMQSAGNHSHTVTTNASTTGATGSGSAFSVMNPYITVYMWKRTT